MTAPKKDPSTLRSQQWFGRQDRDGFAYRSWVKGKGVPHDQFDGRPVIGICNTFSELTPCNSHFRTLAEQVKIGVYEAGGFPLEFPVMSLGETLLRPTAMLYRNLASMDVEESIRGNPIDGVVLLMGCDKTTPSLMMGAASCDLPTIGLSGGPMLNGKFRGKDVGSGTGVWQMSEMVRAGEMTMQEFSSCESDMHRSSGTCMTMGTASTMASMVEALGMAFPENAAIPAADTRRKRLAQLTGRRIVEMVKQDIKMSQIVTRQAFENAIRTNAAIGGSTNAVIHLLAIAGRLGVELKLEDFDKLGSEVNNILNLQPSGKYLMEDFCYAGGLPAVMKEIAHLLHTEVVTANGKTVGQNVADAQNYNTEVIKPQAVVETLWNMTQDDDCYITSDVGQHQMWAAQYYRFDEPRRWINSGGLGTMGVGIPYAMGIKLAKPQSEVFCITGEGSVQMNIQELSTCLQYNTPIKICSLNNRYLGMVRQWQEVEYEGRYSHSYMDALPNFVKLAEAYGHVGMLIERPQDVEPALREARKLKDRTVFMDFRTDPTENVFPMVQAGKGITEMLLGSEDL